MAKLVCPKCGKEMQEMHSKNDPDRVFWGCTGYPDCKFLYGDDPETGKVFAYLCPECGNALSKRERKTGGYYIVCGNAEGHESGEKLYFSPDPENGGAPFLKKCPECGRWLVKRERKDGNGCYVMCGNAEGHKSGDRIYFESDGSPREPLPQPAGQFECPECGQPLKYFRLRKGSKAGQMAFACFNTDGHAAGKPVFLDDDGHGAPVMKH